MSTNIQEAWQTLSAGDYQFPISDPVQQMQQQRDMQVSHQPQHPPASASAPKKPSASAQIIGAVQEIVADSEAYLQKKMNTMEALNNDQSKSTEKWLIMIFVGVVVLFIFMLVLFVLNLLFNRAYMKNIATLADQIKASDVNVRRWESAYDVLRR
uniref:Uncharacterized protein n=1 Tax=viral metagenome TaxID=1070528 RepID=A0A6C0BNB0_9ZZZZ